MKKKLFTIIYEDENIVAVNKASGILCTADRYDESKERLDKLLEKELNQKIFTVHRIDKDTSGLVVFAKNKEIHRKLSMAFENKSVFKKYICIVHGRPSWKETECNLPLVPNGNKKHMTIIDKFKGKKSFTKFNLLHSAGNLSVLEALPETGRIHQIRVHAKAIGHPVVCDPLYGKTNPIKLSSFKKNWKGNPAEERPLLERLGLHALEIKLPNMELLTAPLAKDMNSLITQLIKI